MTHHHHDYQHQAESQEDFHRACFRSLDPSRPRHTVRSSYSNGGPRSTALRKHMLHNNLKWNYLPIDPLNERTIGAFPARSLYVACTSCWETPVDRNFL